MTDHLAALSEAQVAAWYRRLADRISRELVRGQEPLAAIFLRQWLDNRDPTSTFRFSPPSYLQDSAYVLDALRYQRAVFLTEQRARVGSSTIWAGVVPRIQGHGRFTLWDMTRPLDMEYESLVEVGNGLADLVRIQQFGTPEEKDLLTSLRGFQLHSNVSVSGTRLSGSRVSIRFIQWRAHARDRYDWNYSEHFTVPNPDFGSTAAGAVRPGDQSLTVYHRNAQRLERAGLAAPYNVESQPWAVMDSSVVRNGEVDVSRRL